MEIDEKTDRKLSLNAAVQMDLAVSGERFQGVLEKNSGRTCIGAAWLNDRRHKFELNSLMANLGLSLPDALDLSMELRQAMIYYETENHKIGLKVEDERNRFLLLTAYTEKKWFGLRLVQDYSFRPDSLPVIGKYMDNSRILFHYIQLFYKSEGGMSAQIGLTLQLAGNSYEMGEKKPEPPQSIIEREIAALPETVQKPPFAWKEINKKLGPCFIRRAGVSFEGGQIKVGIEGTVCISILTFSFLELYLGLKIGNSVKFSCGLKGMAVSLDKPPLFISGGLYQDGSFYSGQLTVRFKNLSLMALGSYGTNMADGKDSFFAYVMLDYAFGGPPCFYITGLAAGFGVNRKIRIPGIKEVETFPFIAAVRKQKGAIQPGSSTADVLSQLNQFVEPCEGMYFITAGLKFTTFGMVESVAVINITFGKKLECSLLGISELSVPPGNPKPVIYGCLNLRAVFSPDDGILFLEGALSDNTYLLDKNCRVSGGFAFYSWFKGEYAGDFVLTVGGYGPGFNRGRYPAVDRVRISWIISKNLDIMGEAYFAMLPSCLMAGGRLELNFHLGKLKAWFCAYANFEMRFKPFYYDITLGVSVGISYRLDLLFIHHTFSLEMGADLHLWGPEFAGVVHVKWHILSFTIRFNTGGGRPGYLTFDRFSKEFLPDYSGGVAGIMEKGTKYARLQISEGFLGQRTRNTPQGERTVYYVDGGSFSFDVETAMPIQSLQINGNKTGTENICGILPMGINSLSGSLKVTIQTEMEGEEAFEGIPLFKNLPRAIWDRTIPDKNAGLLPNIWMGCRLLPKKTAGRWRPRPAGVEKAWYDLDILLLSETEEKAVKMPVYPPIENRADEGEEQWMEKTFVKNSIRDQWLRQMSGAYSVREPEEVNISHFAEHRAVLAYAPFELRTLGYRGSRR